ncbi:MAG: amidohydrolase family protein [Gammaproteobacteria bacterium]
MMSLPRIVSLSLSLLLIACSSSVHRVTVDSGTQFGVTGNTDGLHFDMQGILWHLPAGSTRANAISDARDDLRFPQLSPDGQRLVMQSFAAGNWDIVITDTQGRNRRVLTQSPFDDREPAWTADGTRILFTSDRSGNEDIWSYELATTELNQLTSDNGNDYAPAALPGDGFLFVSDRTRKTELYEQTDNTLDKLATAPANRLYAPRASPDGLFIAWVQAEQRNGFPGVAINQLVVYNKRTGTQRIVSAPGSDVFAQPPSWLDNNTLLFTADGLIRQVTLNDGAITQRAFQADFELLRTAYQPRTPLAFSNNPQPLRGIVDPVMLPDERIVFTALGDFWALNNGGDLTQLTDDIWTERDAHVAPDGYTLAYIGDRNGSMQVWSRDLRTNTDTQLTTNSPGPRYPTFSPDGTQLAYQQVGPIGTQDFTLRVLDLATGKTRKLRSAPKIWPGRMAWSADSNWLTVAELHKTGVATDGRNRLVRIDVRNDVREVVALPDNLTPDTGPVASPDHRELALVIDGKLYALPVMNDGSNAGAPLLIKDTLVESPAWQPDGKGLLALEADGLTLIDRASGRSELINPELSWQALRPTERQVIHAGRLWDGISNTYVTDSDVLIENGRIVSIEPHSTHAADVALIDASDATLVPGLIDHHVHFQPHQGEWVGRALLAFGVTTAVEPGGLPYESREHFESWLSGKRTGPRLVYSGPQLDGDRRTFHFASHITSEQRLQRELERADTLGYGFIKTYRRLSPELQEAVITGSHAQGLPVTAHAALRNIGFGGDRVEHLRGSGRVNSSPKQSDLLISYGDIQGIYAAPGAAVTPTLLVQGGYFDLALGGSGFQPPEAYNRLYTAAYRRNLSGFSRLVSRKIDLVRLGLNNAGQSVTDLNAAEVNIVAGTDAPIFPYGLSLIIELQNYVDARLTPAEALRTATANAALALGAADDVGTLTPGKLADILIVKGDPLSNVQDLFNLQGVMLNGQYRTLEELLQ